jgi:hypothetical protein
MVCVHSKAPTRILKQDDTGASCTSHAAEWRAGGWLAWGLGALGGAVGAWRWSPPGRSPAEAK